jgi:anthranilate synthase component 2
MKKILIFDNYDSFTYNLVQYVEQLVGLEVDVFRNDEIPIERIENYDKILLSPGPGIPSEAGILLQVIERYATTKSIFGVCLGHQAIAQAFGGELINYKKVYHGIASNIMVIDRSEILFKGIPKTFKGGRYHAWGVMSSNLPKCLQITAIDDEGNIMALKHQTLDIRGVQFHPESVLTEFGMEMISNWLKY